MRWLVVFLIACQSPAPPDWHAQVLYLALTDRFRDGDRSNDNATGCFDRAKPRSFHGGDFAGLRANLDYIQQLGATALWITPPNLQAGPKGECGYHGYWIDYTDPPDGALQPELGPTNQLVGLIDDLHARHMRFVLDMVVNHAGDTARIVAQRPSWFHDPKTCTDPVITCPLATHPDFAQEQPVVAAYLSDAARRMVTRLPIDAIRMDTAKHVPASYFGESFFPAVRAVRPNVWSIAEIFDGSSARVFAPYLDVGFDSAFHYPLHGALVEAIAKGGSIARVAQVVADSIAALGWARENSLVTFVDNHDVPRFASQAGPGVPDDELRRRLLAGYALLFTLPGIPQLYYGDELGMLGGADPDNRRDLPAWAMDPAQRAKPHPGEAIASDVIFARVTKLAHLRTSVPALATGAYRELARDPIYVFERGADRARRVIAVDGGAGVPRDIAIDLPDGTMLVDELGEAPAVTIANGRISLALAPRQAAIYRIAP
ncbi:MAG TPA: alpha-amylase family glycosyl hydrolase [Kofleriaceae bacterium]